MTARRILRRVLLAALLCVLLASAALAVETPTVDSIEDAQANLEKTVEKQEDSFVVSLPSDDYLASYTNALQNHILEQENWVDVSPRITVEPNTGIMQDTAIIVRLRIQRCAGCCGCRVCPERHDRCGKGREHLQLAGGHDRPHGAV